MPTDQSMTVLGKITTAFGIKGWLKVYSYTQPATNIFKYSEWSLKVDNNWQRFKVREGKPQGKGLVVALEGIVDRTAAETLAGSEIGIATDELPTLENDEFYWFQLEGLSVVNQQDECLGKISTVFDSGGHNIVIQVEPSNDSIDNDKRLIPYVDEYVLEVSTDNGVMRVDWESDF